MSAVLTPQAINAILSEARYFLQRIDIERRQLQLVETTREILSQAAFIDGRSALAINGQTIDVPLEQALDWYQNRGHKPVCDRLIAHTAFCGSTLLARALDHTNQSFVYKEPQALIDLVAMKQSGHSLSATGTEWPALVQLCLSQFRKSWSDDEVSVVKPSNWVNILLPELMQCSDDFKVVLLSCSAREFLLATVRGGRDRFAYVLSFLNQIQIEFPHYAQIIAGVGSEGGTGLLGPLKYSAIAFHLQLEVFKRIKADAELAGGERPLSVTLEQLLGQPEPCVRSIAEHLEIPLSVNALSDIQNKVFSSHSKDTQKPFGRDQTAAMNSDIEGLYSQELDQALNWYSDKLASTG